jgi:hypothetical protein
MAMAAILKKSTLKSTTSHGFVDAQLTKFYYITPTVVG